MTQPTKQSEGGEVFFVVPAEHSQEFEALFPEGVERSAEEKQRMLSYLFAHAQVVNEEGEPVDAEALRSEHARLAAPTGTVSAFAGLAELLAQRQSVAPTGDRECLYYEERQL